MSQSEAKVDRIGDDKHNQHDPADSMLVIGIGREDGVPWLTSGVLWYLNGALVKGILVGG